MKPHWSALRPMARRSPALIGLLGLVALAGLTSCGENHDDIARFLPNDPRVTGITPPTPTFLSAEIGDRQVTLFWQVDDDTNVGYYRLYRNSGAGREIIAGGVDDTTYIDTGLSNGTPYAYEVAAVLTNRIEGDRSEPIVVSPNLYGVVVEGGASYVNRRTVTVSMTAPGGTVAMRLAETPDLADVPWRNFSGSTSFEIGSGDGEHTVYASFRDARGNRTAVFEDAITLDTWAEISSVSHDAGSAPVGPEDVVRFLVDAGEAGGAATIAIGNVRTGIVLHDDGLHGDGGADDGVYGVDFVIPLGLEVSDAVVTGSFRDRAGNQAESRSAPQTLSITADEPPPPLAVSEVDHTSISVSLRWTPTPIADFDAYLVYRAQNSAPGVFVLVAEIDQASVGTFTDFFAPVTAQTIFFYKVAVRDAGGASTDSNVVTVRVEP